MPPWENSPTLTIDLEEGPLQLSKKAEDTGRALIEAVLQEFPADSQRLADLVRVRTSNRFHKEAEQYANLVGQSWRNIILANIAYDLAVSMFGCSTMSLATTQGPALARNMDWWPEDLLARATYQIDYQRKGKSVFITASWPGSIGAVSGMSHKGFAVTLNAVAAPEGHSKTGYPVLLHMRRVLEDATSFETALERLTNGKITTGALFMLVGNQNHQRVVIERTPTRHALRWAQGDEPLLVTNDYRALDSAANSDSYELAQTACARFNALDQLARKLSKDDACDDTVLLNCLTDHRVQMGITAQHMIFRPAIPHATTCVPTRLLAD